MKTAQEIRDMLQQRLKHQLQRPGMHTMCGADLELELSGLLYDLKYIDDEKLEGNIIIQELIAEGTYFPSNSVAGVSGIFKNIMPDVKSFMHEICSIYARKAYQLGLLELENILPASEFQHLIERIISGEFSQGCNPDNVQEKLPMPSFQAWKIWCYASNDVKEKWIYFDFDDKFTDNKRHTYLRSIRWPAETFEDGFELTKEGYQETRRGVAHPKTGKEKPRESRWQHLW